MTLRVAGCAGLKQVGPLMHKVSHDQVGQKETSVNYFGSLDSYVRKELTSNQCTVRVGTQQNHKDKGPTGALLNARNVLVKADFG